MHRSPWTTSQLFEVSRQCVKTRRKNTQNNANARRIGRNWISKEQVFCIILHPFMSLLVFSLYIGSSDTFMFFLIPFTNLCIIYFHSAPFFSMFFMLHYFFEFCRRFPCSFISCHAAFILCIQFDFALICFFHVV